MGTLQWCDLQHGILNGVSGYCSAGELVGILGPSGCGKTTLLDTIYSAGSLQQTVLYAGRKITRRDISYVFQEEHFVETLTVYETLEFNSRMRCKIKEDMLKIISDVRFETLLDQRVSTLSGGERKRLGIAVELANDAPVFMLDEPVSSLDSYLAASIVDVLHDIKARRNVLCTIHQPSLDIFMGFDRVNFLHRGSLYYDGPPDALVDHCIRVGVKCPMYTNPAEFFLGIISNEKVDPIRDPPAMRASYGAGTSAPEGGGGRRLHTVLEYWYLLKRAFRDTCRQHVVTQYRMVQSVLFGLIIGSLYFDLGNTQMDIQNRDGCTFFIIVNQMMSVFFSVVQTFPLQLKTFKQEYSKRLYRVGPYYWAKTTADVPVQTVVICAFAALVLPMTNLCPSAARSLMFLGYLLLTSWVFSSFGYFVSTLADDPTVVLIIANIMILPAMLVGGFFINNNSVPEYYVALENVSTFNIAFQALIKCVYDGTELTCDSDGPCTYRDGGEVLEYLGVEMSFGEYAYLLLGQAIFLRVVGHLVLYTRYKAIPTCKSFGTMAKKAARGALVLKAYICSRL